MIESTLSAREVAGLLRVSTRHLRTLVRDGRVPQPVLLGACQRWPAVPFRQWLDAGCLDFGKASPPRP